MPNLDMFTMVRNRLPFLEDTPANQTLVEQWAYEVAWELEPCFRIACTDANCTTKDPDRVGDFQYYSQPQLSVIADLVAAYILVNFALVNMQGADGEPAPIGGRFISKAKAGSAEVEWDQLDINKSAYLLFKPETVLNRLRKDAIRKAGLLGCFFDICDDCSIVWLDRAIPMPFIVAKGGKKGGCGCGCGGNC